jgi:hypothetical protein
MSPGASGYQTEKSAVNRFMVFLHFEYKAEGMRLLIILVSVYTFSLGRIQNSCDIRRRHPLTPMAFDNIPPEIQKLLIDSPELATGVLRWLATVGCKADFLRRRYSDAT